jgi:hypothetical protein
MSRCPALNWELLELEWFRQLQERFDDPRAGSINQAEEVISRYGNGLYGCLLLLAEALANAA